MQTQSHEHRSYARRVAFASLIGTAIEWYDFYIYGTASALALGALFFPTNNALVSTLLAYATFAIGGIMRPLGGMICGHFGDRVGRKSMLVFTLVGMGIVTFLIGVLPTYAQVGILAPILLITLRMLQGFAFGGEWGGAVLMSVEHAPAARRGFYGSFPQMGSPIGMFLATGAFAIVGMWPKEDLLQWGWRVPFLFSAVLVIVGLILRLQLMESPQFLDVVRKRDVAESPVREVLVHHWRTVLLGIGIMICTLVAYYVQTLFAVTYATQRHGVSREAMLHAVLLGSLTQLILLPICAGLSDRIGRRPVALFGAGFTLVSAVPFFMLLDTGSPTLSMVAVALAPFGYGCLYSVIPAYVSSLFEPRVRYTGISACYTIGAGWISGFSPAIATALYAWTNTPWLVAGYLMFIAMISVLSIVLSTPTRAGEQSTHVARA